VGTSSLHLITTVITKGGAHLPGQVGDVVAVALCRGAWGRVTLVRARDASLLAECDTREHETRHLAECDTREHDARRS
jgi:hypothetical protein